jgi:hypothetical protein
VLPACRSWFSSSLLQTGSIWGHTTLLLLLLLLLLGTISII